MDHDTLKKPENLADEIWQQHLEWMDVAAKQVEENFVRHRMRVKQDAGRNKALLDHHLRANSRAGRTQSLFSK